MRIFSRATGVTLLIALILVAVVSCFTATIAAIYSSWNRHENRESHQRLSAHLARLALESSLARLSWATDGKDNDLDGRIDEGLDWNLGLLAPEALTAIEGRLGRIGTEAWTPAADVNLNRRADIGELGVKPVSFAGGHMMAFTLFSQEDGLDNDSDGEIDEPDEAGSVLIIATGIYRGEITVIECCAVFVEPHFPENNPRWFPETAFLCGGRLKISGNPVFRGARASVHSNSELIVTGSCSVEGDVTAVLGLTLSSRADIRGSRSGAARLVPLPYVDPIALRPSADFRVLRTGVILDSRDKPIHDLSNGGTFRGWSTRGSRFFFHGHGVDPAAAAGTWWFDGDVVLTGTGKAGTVSSAGSDCTQTFDMTVLATGSIEMAGDTRLRRVHPDGFLLVAGGDLRLAGEPHADQVLEGILAAREQVRIAGSPEIHGCVVAQDACDLHGLVRESAILGSPTFAWDGGVLTGLRIYDPVFPWFDLSARVVSVEEVEVRRAKD